MAHALLSPSSAARWLACTPSARLESQFPDSSGAAAAEGTVAHALGELLLREWLGVVEIEDFQVLLAEIEGSEYYGPDMQRYAEDYRDFVIERYHDALASTPDPRIFLEQKLDMTEFVPEGFGTGDCIILADGTLDIIDLKYGKGVLVNAQENKQMMLYGLAAMRQFEIMYDIRRVRMTIYQPRLDNYSSYELPVEELLHWAETELKERAKMAFEGTGELVVGKHCGFCKVKARCRAMADYNMQLAQHDFKQPELLDDHEVSDILKRLDLLTDWAGAVKKFALQEALGGRKWEGFKLVEGRSVRRYVDEDAAAKAVLKQGWPEESVFNKKIIGLTAMEKLIGKPGMVSILGDHVDKPPGAPTLVPESDKRPEYNAAASDFAKELAEA